LKLSKIEVKFRKNLLKETEMELKEWIKVTKTT
jgi:hypothetical protein